MPQTKKFPLFLFSLLLIALSTAPKSEDLYPNIATDKMHKQNALLKLTISQLEVSQNGMRTEVQKLDDLMQIEKSRFAFVKSEKDVTPYKNVLTLSVRNISQNKIPPHIATINEAARNKIIDSENETPQYIYFNEQTQISDNPEIITAVEEKQKNHNNVEHIGYWQTVHSIESKEGKLLYRPRNKARNCTYTTGPCGHHQLTVQALRDIGCTSLQCRKDRLDYNKSLKLSKRLLALNEKRLNKNGLSNLEGYQKYLIHQQGASGLRNIIAATKGNKKLSRRIKKNMANNSPYSYKHLKRLSSKAAARKFMLHWESKWLKEKRLIAGISPEDTENLENELFIPTFSDNEITLALNYKF